MTTRSWTRRALLGTTAAGLAATAVPLRATSLSSSPATRSTFECKKKPALGSRAMVVTNHPLASAAGVQAIANGGNAIDAAVCALFTLSIVEPMNVGILGGGSMHVRLPDGRHTVFDGLSTAPAAARADMYRVLETEPFAFTDVADRANSIGPLSVGVPGNLHAWCRAAERFGCLPLADLLEPAIRYARNGFKVTPYLSSAITRTAADLSRDAHLARVLLPNGAAPPPGSRLVQSEAAEALQLIAREGPRALSHGAIGERFAAYVRERGGLLAATDLKAYSVAERDPVRGHYRGFEIVGPAPPCASGVYIVHMLKMLEAFDLKALGFGSAQGTHLLAECMKAAFADRAVTMSDPAFIRAPVAKLISPEYAAERRRLLDAERPKKWSAGVPPAQPIDPASGNTTHVTVADDEGHVVSATHSINGWFGARFLIPGLGLIPDNYMHNLDPRPGRPLSIAPGKRVTSSDAPMIVLRDGRTRFALGLPGGLRIFGCAMQTIINLIDHEMSLQEAVEAPRVWTQGQDLEVEHAIAQATRDELTRRGHTVAVRGNIGGGMNAVAIHRDGRMEGAACWRADGMPMGVSGGLAAGT